MSVNKNRNSINLLVKIGDIISAVKPAKLLDVKIDENINNYKKIIGVYQDVDCLEIKRRIDKSCIQMLFFHRKVLKEILTKKTNLDFLMRLGYPDEFDMDIYLKLLKTRLQSGEIPCEIGMFLGDSFKKDVCINNC